MSTDPKPNISAELVGPPPGADAAWAPGFTWEEARAAIEEHERGGFCLSAQLALQCRRYPPIRAALAQRRASPCGLPWRVDGPERAPGRFETALARLLWARIERLLGSIVDDLATMGFSVIQHPIVVDPVTLRHTVSAVERWPISATGYSPYDRRGVQGYYAVAAGGRYIQLPEPGTTDGHWTVIGAGDRPHILDASVTSLDVSYVAGQILERARANLGVTMGRASPYLIMPEKVPTEGVEGEAARATLAGMGTRKAGAIFPHGSEVGDFEVGTSTYAFFGEALRDRILMIALAILGRGGALAKTDAQYVSPVELDVPESLVRADVRTIVRAVNALLALVANLNLGLDAESAPRLVGPLPDTDQEQVLADLGKRRQSYFADLEKQKALGVVITQEIASATARQYRVTPIVVPAPVLAPPAPTPAPPEAA